MVAHTVYTESIVNVVDVMGEIISSVQSKYDLVNGEKPYFHHGHPLEIINTLQEYSNSSTLRFKKFPIIALFEDFESSKNEGVFSSVSKLNLIIATDTLPEYVASNRYELSFNAILTPIYNLFINELNRSRLVHTQRGSIEHTPINRLYWGKNGLYGNSGNVFNDYIDAIEIKDLVFKIYR